MLNGPRLTNRRLMSQQFHIFVAIFNRYFWVLLDNIQMHDLSYVTERVRKTFIDKDTIFLRKGFRFPQDLILSRF